MTPKNTNTLRPKSHVTHSDLRTWRVAKTFLAYSVVCTLSCHVLKGLPRGSSNENLLEIKRYPIISVLASWWIPCTTSSNGPSDTITCTIYGKRIFSYLILSYLSHFGSLQAFLIFARPFSQSHSGLPCLLHGFQGWTRCSWSRTRDLNAQEIPKIRSWWSWWFGTAGSMAFRFTTRRAIWPKHSQASHRLNLQIGFDMKVEHQYVEEEIPACVNFCSCVLGGYDLRLASVDLTSVSDSKITWTKQ